MFLFHSLRDVLAETAAILELPWIVPNTLSSFFDVQLMGHPVVAVHPVYTVFTESNPDHEG